MPPRASSPASRAARAGRPSPDEAAEAPTAFDEIAAEGPLEPGAAVEAYRALLAAGEPWYPALLRIVSRWTAADETLDDGTTRVYLIAGEAFDWLRLAERLLDAAGDRVPADEVERLLLHGEAPDGSDEDEFARAIGPQKHRAHLNFQYGVVIEEALLLADELELHKARTIDGVRGEPPDVVAYERVYGKPLGELQMLYLSETGAVLGSRASQSEWQAFIYWCSKYRFRTGEPARVASDTRKALALLSRLRAERPRPTLEALEEDSHTTYIDSVAYAEE